MENAIKCRTSLPSEITQAIKAGDHLAGDAFDEQALQVWYEQEREAFFETNAVSGLEDPWYQYMKYVNKRLGFSLVESLGIRVHSVLVLGPGSGEEVEEFARRHPECHINFVEASEGFRAVLREKYPKSTVIEANPLGDIPYDDNSVTLVTAFSVLHHIPNVSKIVQESSRVLQRGGLFLVREPCSSMGDWRFPRSATPNERGISHRWMERVARHHEFELIRSTPILFEPINRTLKRTIGFGVVPFKVIFALDRVVSYAIAWNNHYWRDRWWKKLGPSSFFYVFRKRTISESRPN